MRLRDRLALRYALVAGLCLVLLGGLVYHEFVTEPRERKALGIPELPESDWGEYAEVFFYGMIPVVLAGGWWLMRRTLAPLSQFTEAVKAVDAEHLRVPLPRTGNGDEVDRLTEVFNSMAERLDNSFQQIRHFTLHASHELKTPLTIMRVQLESKLRDTQSLPPEQIVWLECEWEEVQRLSRIVDALTFLTKADSGLIALEQKLVPLGELVRESFEDAQILAEPSRVTTVLTECQAAEVVGDRDRLRQLLLNLTDNAIKYNQPGGLVEIALRKAGDEAQIMITNTGKGVPEELQPKLFERFVRGDEARHRAIEGCGLGLAICRWIVQAHHGSIRISSIPEKSTTVLVCLPLASTGG